MVTAGVLLGALFVEGALFASLLILQHLSHTRTERDLLDRIQVGSLAEYHAVTAGKKEPTKGRSHSLKVMEEQGVEQA